MAAALRWLLGIDAATDKWDPHQFTVEGKGALPAVGLAEAAAAAPPPPQPSLCSTFHYRNPSSQDPMRVDQPPLRCQRSAWLEEEVTHFPTGTSIRVNQLEPGLYDETQHNSFRTERRVYKGRRKDRFTGKMVDLYEDDPPPPNGDFQTFGGKHALRRLQGDDLSQAPYEGLQRQETTFAEEPMPDTVADQAVAAERHTEMERIHRDIVFNQDGKTPFDEPYRKQDAYPVGYIGRQNMLRHTPVLPPTARETITGCSGAVECVSVRQQPVAAAHRGTNKPSLQHDGERGLSNAFGVAAKRDTNIRLPTASQMQLPQAAAGKAGAHDQAERSMTTHLPRKQRQLPTAAGHGRIEGTADAPGLSTHKDSTLAGASPHLTTAPGRHGGHSEVAHLDKTALETPTVGLLQVGHGGQAASQPTVHLAEKEQAAGTHAALQQPAQGMARNTQSTQEGESTQPGSTHMASAFPHTQAGDTPGVTREGKESHENGAGPASFPGGALPVSDTSHQLRTDSTYSPLVTVWNAPSTNAAVAPQVKVADHEQTVERNPTMQSHTMAAGAPSAVRTADREVADTRHPQAQQEDLGGRTASGTTDHVASAPLGTLQAGQPCHAMGSDARDHHTERQGHDALSLVESTQAGGHGAARAAPVAAAVQCADQEKSLPTDEVGSAPLQVPTVHSTPTTALAPALQNTRTTFGVGEGDQAHPERMPGQCTLKEDRATADHDQHADVEQHAERLIPEITCTYKR